MSNDKTNQNFIALCVLIGGISCVLVVAICATANNTKDAILKRLDEIEKRIDTTRSEVPK